MKSFLRAHKGSIAVEFALLIPIFLLIFAGIVEFGRYYWEQQVLSAAAREGARAASVSLTADINAVVINYVSNYGGLNTASVDVSHTTEQLPGDAASTLEVVTVTKPYDFYLLSRLLSSWLQSVTVTGRAKMIKEV